MRCSDDQSNSSNDATAVGYLQYDIIFDVQCLATFGYVKGAFAFCAVGHAAKKCFFDPDRIDVSELLCTC